MAQQGGSLPPAPLPQQPGLPNQQLPPQPQTPGVPGATPQLPQQAPPQSPIPPGAQGAEVRRGFKKGGTVKKKKKKKPGLKGFKKKAGKGKTGAAFAKATSGRRSIQGPLGATPKGAIVGSPGGENPAERKRRLAAQARKKSGGGTSGAREGRVATSPAGPGGVATTGTVATSPAGPGGTQGGAGGAAGAGGDPFTGINTPGNVGAGTGTLNQLLATGAPTDVQPIIDANAAAAQRNFAQLVDPSITEEFGALGLGSSSARQAATGREAGNVAARLGEEGARLGVGAQEAATGRRLQAFSPLQSAQGQTLQDIISRRGDVTQRFGIETGADVAREGITSAENISQARLASGETIASGAQNVGLLSALLPGILSGINNPINPGNTPSSGTSPLAGSTGGLFARGGEVGSSPDFLKGILSRLSGAGAENLGGGRPGSTGSRENITDFLSNLVFGRNFEKRQPEPTRGVGGSIGRGLAGSRRTATGAPTFRPGGSRSTSGRRDPSGGAVTQREEKFNPLDFIEALGARGANIFPSGGGSQPTDFQRGALQLGGNLGDFLQSSLRRPDLGFAVGGEVPGPASPPDQVPILATGGEIVVPPDLVAKLGASTNPDPLIQDLQALIGKPGEGAGDSFQQGGAIPTEQGNEFLQGITGVGGATGGPGVPSFSNQDLDSPLSQFGQGAGGTVSQLGVPTLESQLVEAGESPEIIELMRQRQLANSSLSNFKAAFASGTQGTNENLIPFLEQAQAEVQNIDQTIVGVREAETAKQNAEAAKLNAQSFEKRADAELLRAGQDPLEQEIPAQQFRVFNDARKIILTENPSLSAQEVDAMAAAHAVNTFGEAASPILTRLMSEVEATKADEPVDLSQGFPQDPLEVEKLISQGLPDEFRQDTLAVAMQVMQQFVDASPNQTNEELIAAMAEQFPGMVQFLMTNTQEQ